MTGDQLVIACAGVALVFVGVCFSAYRKLARDVDSVKRELNI